MFRRRRGLSSREVLLIGDSTADAGAARAAGCPSVGVTWGTHSRAALADASFDRLIDRPDELGALIVSGQFQTSAAPANVGRV